MGIASIGSPFPLPETTLLWLRNEAVSVPVRQLSARNRDLSFSPIQ